MNYSKIGNFINDFPNDIFPTNLNLKNILLQRSIVSRNKPFYYSIVDSLIQFKNSGYLIVPCEYELIKSCDTLNKILKFQKKYYLDLISLDLDCQFSFTNFIKKIGIKGIFYLSGMRHTTGSFYNFFF